jgi:hypothetical protein
MISRIPGEFNGGETLKRRGSFLAALVLPGSACAQQYPNRPLRMVIPWPAGQATDLVGRVVAEKRSQIFGQPRLTATRCSPVRRAGRRQSAAEDTLRKFIAPVKARSAFRDREVGSLLRVTAGPEDHYPSRNSGYTGAAA